MKFLRLALALSLIMGGQGNITAAHTLSSTPHVTIVIVIDQLAYSHIIKLRKHLKFGFDKLLKKGITFTNAHHPHGNTCTAAGHAALGTGTLAKDHGIILNSWRDINGKSQGFKDKNRNAAQFTGLHPTNVCSYGISAKNLLVSGVSDQVLLSSTPETFNQVYSISYKPRAAIGMGGHLGKSIWFDHNTLTFTSSKSFFKQLPEWIINFNKKNDLTKIKQAVWKPAYSRSHKAYDFKNIHDYRFASQNAPRAGTKISMHNVRNNCACTLGPETKKNIFVKLPQANQLLLDLASTCLDATYIEKNHPNKKLLLWVSLSTLDMIGHAYGPDCFETIDMIYHLDKQLKKFIKSVQKKVGKNKALFVLTADHGVMRMPEYINKNENQFAHRILQKDLVKKLNQIINEQFGIPSIIAQVKSNHFYLNKSIQATLEPEKIRAILHILKTTLKNEPGIHTVWTSEELSNASYQPWELESYYKNQHYPGRSGDLICMPRPHSFFAKSKHGTSHCSPYKETTHVPLIFYHPGTLSPQTITSRVFIPQVPVTIADILQTEHPSASPFEPLQAITNHYQMIKK